MRGHQRRLLAVVLLSALSVQGCALHGTKSKAGHPVDVCAGLAELDTISEPAITSTKSALEYAASYLRVLGRIDFKIRYFDSDNKLHDAPQEVRRNLGLIEAAVTRYRDEIRSADGDVAKLRLAASRLSSDESFAAASTAVTQFRNARCRGGRE